MANRKVGTVEARRFVLKDSRGRERARIELEDDSPALKLMDSTGKVRLCLAAYEDGPTVALYGPDEELRALLSVKPSGPNLSLFRPEGEVEYGRLAITRDSARIREEYRPVPQLELFVEASGPGLALYGLEEKSRALMTAEDHGAALSLDAPSKRSKVEIHADIRGAHVLLYGADGKPARSIE